MPDDIITDAVGQFMAGGGPFAGLCILLMAVLVWRERTYRADLKEWQGKHDTSRGEHLADVKAYAEIGESVRDQVKALVVIVQGAVDLMKERQR